MARRSREVVRLGISELERRLGVTRITIWRWYTSGRFPRPEYVSDNRAWRLDAVEEWERAQLARAPSARRGRRNIKGAASKRRRGAP